MEGEETDDGTVEDEEGGSEVENEEQDEDASEEESEGDSKKNVHKDADTYLLFTKPSIINQFESGSVELPAGKVW